MPEKAKYFLEASPSCTLPEGMPYLGMGSSYFAPLAFKYMGLKIFPDLASEFFHYQHQGKKMPAAVLLSQSGKSTEVLWCAQLFEEYIAISNYTDSPLCVHPGAAQIIHLLAGDEQYSSSKTYINTLLALFKGFGMEMRDTVQLLSDKMHRYNEQGSLMADALFDLLQRNQVKGMYITGSGPNIATAMQAALILSESTKLNFNGMPMAQYDHGPKETAKDSIVIQVLAKGKTYDRTTKLADTIRAAGAHIFTVEEPEAAEHASILPNIIPFNYLAYYLSQKLNVAETFIVGGKVTEVNAP